MPVLVDETTYPCEQYTRCPKSPGRAADRKYIAVASLKVDLQDGDVLTWHGVFGGSWDLPKTVKGGTLFAADMILGVGPKSVEGWRISRNRSRNLTRVIHHDGHTFSGTKVITSSMAAYKYLIIRAWSGPKGWKVDSGKAAIKYKIMRGF